MSQEANARLSGGLEILSVSKGGGRRLRRWSLGESIATPGQRRSQVDRPSAGGSRRRCCHSAGASADAAAHPAAGRLTELRDAQRRQQSPAPNKAWQVGRGALCKYPSGLRTTEEGSRGGRGKRMDCSLIWTKRCFSQALWL